MARSNLYTPKTVENTLNALADIGYEIVTIEGSLIDNYICLPPDDGYVVWEFYECYLNEWSSAYRYRTSKKISRRLARLLEEAGYC